MPTHPQHGSLGCNQGSHSLVHHDLLTLTRFLCPPSLHFVHPFPAHILTAPCYLSPPQPRHRSSLTITPSSAPLPTLLRPLPCTPLSSSFALPSPLCRFTFLLSTSLLCLLCPGVQGACSRGVFQGEVQGGPGRSWVWPMDPGWDVRGMDFRGVSRGRGLGGFVQGSSRGGIETRVPREGMTMAYLCPVIGWP